MAKYKFPQFSAVIENPEITINPVVRNVNPVNMTIAVDIVMSVPNASFGVSLENVPVQNLTYTSETLTDRVMEKLSEFIVA